MSCNPTPMQHLNAVSSSIMSIISALSDVDKTEQPIADVVLCFTLNYCWLHKQAQKSIQSEK